MGAVAADLVRGHEGSGDDAEDAEREERGGKGNFLDWRATQASHRAADQVVVVGDGEGVVHVRHSDESRGAGKVGTRLAWLRVRWFRDLETRGRIGESAGGEEAEAWEAGKGDDEESDGAVDSRGRCGVLALESDSFFFINFPPFFID